MGGEGMGGGGYRDFIEVFIKMMCKNAKNIAIKI